MKITSNILVSLDTRKFSSDICIILEKNGRLKKTEFFNSANFQKFHGLVLGLVGLIDAKGIDFAQPIWP